MTASRRAGERDALPAPFLAALSRCVSRATWPQAVRDLTDEEIGHAQTALWQLGAPPATADAASAPPPERAAQSGVDPLGLQAAALEHARQIDDFNCPVRSIRPSVIAAYLAASAPPPERDAPRRLLGECVSVMRETAYRFPAHTNPHKRLLWLATELEGLAAATRAELIAAAHEMGV